MSKSGKTPLCADGGSQSGTSFEDEGGKAAVESTPVPNDGDSRHIAAPDVDKNTADNSYTALAYVYDGTFEGLLSAVFATYANHEEPADIAPEQTLQLRLGQLARSIPTNMEHAERVRCGICRTCGSHVFETVKEASLSDDPETGTIVYMFVRHIMSEYAPRNRSGRTADGNGIHAQAGKNVLSDIAHPAVGPLVRLARAVGNERHRMMQFLRFEHLEGDVWFARCNPNANVVPLLMDWFSGRFNTQAFIIYDEAHGIAGVYDGASWNLVRTDQITPPAHAADEQTMQRAWKRFYQTVAVESRYNPELRRQFMPKRLWKNIIEMQESGRDRPLVQPKRTATSSTLGKAHAEASERKASQLPGITRPSPHMTCP